MFSRRKSLDIMSVKKHDQQLWDERGQTECNIVDEVGGFVAIVKSFRIVDDEFGDCWTAPDDSGADQKFAFRFRPPRRQGIRGTQAFDFALQKLNIPIDTLEKAIPYHGCSQDAGVQFDCGQPIVCFAEFDKVDALPILRNRGEDLEAEEGYSGARAAKTFHESCSRRKSDEMCSLNSSGSSSSRITMRYIGGRPDHDRLKGGARPEDVNATGQGKQNHYPDTSPQLSSQNTAGGNNKNPISDQFSSVQHALRVRTDPFQAGSHVSVDGEPEARVHGYPGGQWDSMDLMTVELQCPLVGFQEIGTPSNANGTAHCERRATRWNSNGSVPRQIFAAIAQNEKQRPGIETVTDRK
ncbi:hypothetical protein C8R47DRAFT_1252514 [Mycena vitilis]|nr:hypothetical protein C8R47DRAFT_1252514 [Mycena vitilis]